jgi:DNA polymerase gamma 1
VLEEYRLCGTNTRYLDTMSLHMATSGLSTQQAGTWRKDRATRREHTDDYHRSNGIDGDEHDDGDFDLDNENDLEGSGERYLTSRGRRKRTEDRGGDGSDVTDTSEVLPRAPAEQWMDVGSPPNLKDCYKHWCGGDLSKEVRACGRAGGHSYMHAL